MRIINPVKYIEYRGKLVAMRAEAVKQHRPRSDIEAELRAVTTALIQWQLRQERKAA